jgi:hypothetical protein
VALTFLEGSDGFAGVIATEVAERFAAEQGRWALQGNGKYFNNTRVSNVLWRQEDCPVEMLDRIVEPALLECSVAFLLALGRLNETQTEQYCQNKVYVQTGFPFPPKKTSAMSTIAQTTHAIKDGVFADGLPPTDLRLVTKELYVLTL